MPTTRARTYFRALATVPSLTIHYGHFITRTATRRCVEDDRRGRPRFVDAWITEEKGSDVNLASHLLIDGFRARYDLAVVVSNDQDLKEPVQFVRHELKAPVGVLNPHNNRSYALSPKVLPRGSFYKPIRRGHSEPASSRRRYRTPAGAFTSQRAGRHRNRNGHPKAAAHPRRRSGRGG